MLGNGELRPDVLYDPIWLMVGIGLLALSAAWVGLVFFITRNKKQKTLANLPAKPYVPPDFTPLKQKYLALIEDVGRQYTARRHTARSAHQALSRLLRFFVYEANGHRVDALTLSDLKRTRYESLAKAIESYYQPEFRRVEQGSVQDAVQLAKEVVTQWN